jgi:hypothetical protein
LTDAHPLGFGLGMKRVLLGLAIGLSACLPKPESVREHRENFDREAIRGSLLLETPPIDMHRVDAEFGSRAKLLGYTTDPASPQPGDRTTIKLYWTATAPMAEDYQVFVHGDAIGGNASRLHGDHYPADGKYPTDVWREGDVVVDPFVIWIPPGYGPKQLGIYLGLYFGNYRVPLSSHGLAPADSENRSQAITLNFQ